jgi:hypothetical protein
MPRLYPHNTRGVDDKPQPLWQVLHQGAVLGWTRTKRDLAIDVAALGFTLRESGLPLQECWRVIGFNLQSLVNSTLDIDISGRCERQGHRRTTQRGWTGSMAGYIFCISLIPFD